MSTASEAVSSAAMVLRDLTDQAPGSRAAIEINVDDAGETTYGVMVENDDTRKASARLTLAQLQAMVTKECEEGGAIPEVRRFREAAVINEVNVDLEEDDVDEQNYGEAANQAAEQFNQVLEEGVRNADLEPGEIPEAPAGTETGGQEGDQGGGQEGEQGGVTALSEATGTDSSTSSTSETPPTTENPLGSP